MADEQAKRANEEALKRMTREAKEADPNAEVIELPDEDDEDDEPPPAAAGAREEQDQVSRSERRRNRYREAQDDARRAREESTELRARIAGLEQRVQAPPPAPAAPSAPQEDPFEARLKTTRKAAQDLQNDWDKVAQARNAEGKPIATSEDRQRYQDRWYELQTQTNEIIAERAAAKAAAQNQGNPTADRTQAVLEARYFDVVNHPDGALSKRVLAYANAEWARETVALGKTQTLELLDEVMEKSRVACGLKKAPPPTAATKARFSGISAGARGAATAAGGGKGPLVLSKADKQMARAMYSGSGITEKQMYQRWAQNQRKRQQPA